MTFGQDVSVPQIRSWVRSLILWDGFGSDEMASVTRVPGEDNILDGADAGHDARFTAALNRLRAAIVPGGGSFTNDAAVKYFSSQLGAFRSLVLTDKVGNPLANTVSADTSVTGSAS